MQTLNRDNIEELQTVKAPGNLSEKNWSTCKEKAFIRGFLKDRKYAAGIRYCLMIIADVRVWDPGIDKGEVILHASTVLGKLMLRIPHDKSQAIMKDTQFKLDCLMTRTIGAA